MGTGGGAPSRHAQKYGLNRTRGCRFFNFLLLSGLHPSEGLFGSSIAAQTMQEPSKQTSHAALRNSQVVSITSSIPVPHTIPQLAPGTDMLTSPTFHLSHYLYRSALIATLFNKQCIALVYFCITFFLYICSLTTCCTHTHWYGQNTPGALVPLNMV